MTAVVETGPAGVDSRSADPVNRDLPVRISSLQQWWALTTRGIMRVLRSGDFIFAFVSPAFVGVCYYLPLRKIMDMAPGMNYAQYLMPIIVLQSLAFAASSAGMRSAFDGSDGIHTRFEVLPMPASIPMLARTATNGVLITVSLLCGAIAAAIIGWRPENGVIGVIATFGIALIIGLLLTLCADGIGLVAGSPQATSQAIALPTLILGMLSTGLVPAERFPEWIRPFARNQPISQFVDTLRAADTGTLTWQIIQPSVYWCAGLVVVATGLFTVYRRRRG